MKFVTKDLSIKSITSTLVVILIAITISSCAKKINFQTSSIVPAARGVVKVKKDNNNNYGISIKIFNLAEAKRLPSSEQTYVVWMESNNDRVKNLGQINSSNKLFSKKLKASFETVSSIKPIKILITAENNSSVQYPSNELILTTNSF